jgi:hypothetical protein
MNYATLNKQLKEKKWKLKKKTFTKMWNIQPVCITHACLPNSQL